MSSIFRRSQAASLVTACVLAFCTGVARAQSATTWTGGGANGDWSTVGNWNNGAPTTSGTWALEFAGATQTTTTNDIGGTSDTVTLSSLAFTNTQPFTLSAADSRTLTLANNATVSMTGAIASGSSNVITIPIVLSGSSTFSTDNTGRTLRLDGAVSGTGSMAVTGGYVYVNNGGNSFNGGFSITGGVVGIGHDGVFGSSTLTIGGGTLDARGGSRTVSNSGTITNNFTFGTANPLTLAGSFDLTGANRTITVAGTGTMSGVISNGGLTKSGAGTLTLAGANTYSGQTVIDAGVLSISNANNLGAAPGSLVADQLTLNGGTLRTTAFITWNATRGITLGASGGTIDVGTSILDANTPGLITGTGALTKNGAGQINLNANSYAGGLVLNQGTIKVRNNSTVVSDVVTAGVAGTGTFTINGGSIIGSGFQVNLYANQFLVRNDFSVNPGASDSQKLRVRLGGPLDLDAGTRTVSLGRYTSPSAISAANSALEFGGTPTTVGNGAFRFVRDSGGTASDYAGLMFNSVTFTSDASLTIGPNVITVMPGYNNTFGTNGANQPRVTVELGGYLNLSDTGNTASSRSLQIRTLSGTGHVTNLASSGLGTLTINAQEGDTATFDGLIVDGSVLNASLGTSGSATIALNKSGAGTQILSGNNNYSGSTTVSAGTLQIGVGGTAGSLNTASTITGNSGATLAFNRSNTITQGSDFNAVIGGSINVAQRGSGMLLLNGANTYSGTTSIHAGTLALGAAGSFANSSVIIVGDAGSAGAVLDLTAKTAAFSIGAGQLLGGGGTVRLASSGTLNVLGTFSPGNSPGLFTYDAGTTVLSGTTIMELLGTSRATSPSHGAGFYDAVDIVNNGILQFGGLLTLEFSSLFDNNTTFDLFTPEAGSALAGNFSGVNVGGSFYTGLSWNETGGVWKSSNTIGGQSLEFSSVTGQLVIVPEPAGLLLAAIGGALTLGTMRRRWRRA